MMFFKSYLFSGTIVVAVAVFLNYPADPLSNRLEEWIESGKMFRFQNKNIFYLDDEGKGQSNDVLLCIHGFPTSSFDFLKIFPGLHEEFGRIIAPDMLGFGFSDKPKGHNYTVFEQADMITTLLEELTVNNIHILAHDLGDTVAQELLARFENGKDEPVIKSVTLLNGGILPETNFPKFIQKVLLNKYLAPVLMRLTNFMVFRKSISDVFGEYTKPSEQDIVDFWSGIRWNDGYMVSAGLLQYINQRHANRDRWVHVLQATRIPLHLIYGPSDPINGPETFLKRFRQLVPKCSVDVLHESISHYPHWEDPENVIKCFKNFIKPVLSSSK
ncbi:mesoderm-specific transcript homolog protein-like isoform X1 [Anneissia japonica]|uniref:mesoderm-specific transcript homolog protein-like isoform X1 n=2 Tax=Anneissia japonica TaxID=1529436 RepID=UPI001425A5D0|nr:mesoderm-specific transcript homolog protein-like isoform X1 [Anneissia japonica]